MLVELGSSLRPYSLACVANDDCRTRSAHSWPHQLRSAGSANVHVELDDLGVANPAAATQAGSQRPASACGPVALGQPVVQLHPAVEPLVGGRPHERAVVAVAHGQQPARAQHPAHLA